MFCTQCGKQLETGARFCPSCGMVLESATPTPFKKNTGRQLVRSRSRRVIGGVCGGFADHYGWDLTLVRVLTVAITLFTGVTLFVYIAAWIIIPDGQYALPFGAPMPPPPPPGTTGTAAS